MARAADMTWPSLSEAVAMRRVQLRNRAAAGAARLAADTGGPADRPLRVLMVVDTLRLGGAERVLVSLARAAPAAGFTFSVVALCAPGGGMSAMTPMLTAAGVSTSFLGISRLADPRAVPRIVQAIRHSQCDVVHAHLDQASTLVPPAWTPDRGERAQRHTANAGWPGRFAAQPVDPRAAIFPGTTSTRRPPSASVSSPTCRRPGHTGRRRRR